MKRKVTVMLAVLLVMAFVFQTAPEGSVRAEGTTQNESVLPQEETKAEIVNEIEERRESNVKHFRMSDGSVMAAVYPEAVHKMEDGRYVDIDNTLVEDGDSYKNIDGLTEIHFSKKPKSNKMVQIQLDDYEISFGIEKAKNKQVKIKNYDNETKKKSEVIKNSSTAIYQDVFSGIDLVYDLTGAKLKENIVLNRYTGMNSFVFHYDFGTLTPELRDDGSVILKDGQNEVFRLAAPFMYDAANAESEDVTVTLTPKGSGYEYTLTASEQWLTSPERVYPVTIDPTTSTFQTESAIYDTYINPQYPDYTRRELRDRLLIGTSNGGGDFGGQTFEQYRTYIWFDMPDIPVGSRVSDAKLTLFCHLDEWKNYQDIEEGISIDLYEITDQSVAISDLCWNTRSQVTVRDEVTDYQCLRLGPAAEGDYYQWNITSLIDHYYEIKNSGNASADYKPGMMLRFRDENVQTNDFYAGFHSGNSSKQYLRPAIVLYYSDAKGIESYYDYFASSMTGAGSGYANAFNGNLVYSVPLISETGTRMPLNISLAYNSANVAVDNLGFGPGWKFSFQQYIEKVEESDTNAYTYYAYTDADGTEHYFSEYDGKFVDESGSGMVLTDDGTGITIQQEEEEGKAYFRYISGKAYLEYIENESGDRQTLTYNGTRVSKITDGAGREVTVLYGTDRVNGLRDAAGRTISFYYENGVLLWKIVYFDGDAIQFDYSANSQLNHIIAPDGKEIGYTYDMFKRICGIQEFDRNKVCAYEYKISYDHKNTTRITDSFGRELLYQFDFYGKTVSVTDEEGNAVYSAYSNMNPNEGGSAETNYYLRNKLLLESQMQKTVVNYIMNNSAEENISYWTVQSGTVTASEEEKMLGYNSFRAAQGRLLQSFEAEEGHSYTFSSYIKVAAGGSGGLEVCAGSTELAASDTVTNSSEWERVSVTFTAEEDQTINLVLQSDGVAYFDCIQLEDGPIMNRFNLLSNGGFDFGSWGWDGMDLWTHTFVTEQTRYQDNFPQEYVLYSQSFESTVLPENWQGFTGNYNTWSVTPSTAVAKEGSYSLKLSNRVNSWSSPAFNLYETFKENGAGVYRISFWMYTDTLTTPENAAALIRGTEENSFISAYGSNFYYRASEPREMTAGAWTQFQCEVYVTEDDLKEDTGQFWMMIDTLPGQSGQNLYIDDFSVTASPSFEVKNGDFSDGTLLWMGQDGAEISVSDGVLQAELSGEESAVTYSVNSILKRFGAGSYKLSFRARGFSSGSWTADAYLMDEDDNKIHLYSLGSTQSGQWGALDKTIYLSQAQLDQLNENGRIWLCFGSDEAASIELDDIIFSPIGEEDKVLRLEGKYMNQVSLRQRVYMDVEDSGSIVIGGWAKADAVPDNEEYNDGRWFGMYAKIYYADSAGATKVVPVEFNTAVRIDDDTTNAPWQYVCGAVPLKSDYKTEIDVLYVDLYLCYNNNINYAYFDDIQMYYEEFGQAYSYDEKGNVISSVDAANQKTTFQNTGRDVSSLSSPDGTGFEYVYNDKGFLTEYRSSSGVGGKYTYDNYGNPVSATVRADEYSQSIQSGEYYYFNYGGKYLKYRSNIYPNIHMSFPSQGDEICLKVMKTDEGYYKISFGNMYLEKNEVSDYVDFNTHNYGIGQDWKIIPEANGQYRIISRSTQGSNGEGEQVLTVDNGYVTCTKDGTTRWYLRHVEKEWNGIAEVPVKTVPENDKKYLIMSLYTGSYIEDYDYRINMSLNNGTEFYLEDAGDGYFYILQGKSDDDSGFSLYMCYDESIAEKFAFILGYYRGLERAKFRFAPLSFGYAIQTYSGQYLHNTDSNIVVPSSPSSTGQGIWLFYEVNQNIVTTAQYSNTYHSNYLTSQTDTLGNTVTYAYDFSKGLMTSATDAKGNTTTYTYDNSDRVSSVSQSGISVSYSYSNDQLSEITHNGFTYNFIYDAMGRSKKISVGERVLVENMYYAETGLLRKAEYGNGASRSYEYDKQGRVTKLLLNDSVRYEYTYNSEGSLTELKDVLSGVTYRYVYDLLGRPVSVSTSTGFGIRLTYDQYNRTSDVKFSFGETQLKTTWRYGDSEGTREKNGVIYGVKYNGIEKLTYTYDALGRRTESTIHTTNPFVTEYQFKDGLYSHRTSTLLEKISYSNDRPYIYAYDANGNITSISTENNGTQMLLVSYEYDALNQLVRENAAERNKTIVYTYDNGGNITSIKEYAYTTGEVSGTPVEKTYTYGNTEWKDLLTNYNGTAITYDTIGNPLNWTNGKTFTWTAGRQLSGVTDANNTIAYTYDDNGIRTSKTVNGVKTDYYLNGTTIIMQKTGDQCIWYTYDESGNLFGLRVGSSEYYYYRNGQGDIIGIIDGTGSIVVKYSYDAWGTPIAITDGAGNDVSGNASHIANINPFRYRGYFYDVETGLYYLQSRYYDSQVGRFVNADGYISTGQDVLGHNMFAYCGNNPVNMSDLTGEFAITATLGGIALWKMGLAVAGAVGAFIVTDAIAKNPPALPSFPLPKKEHIAPVIPKEPSVAVPNLEIEREITLPKKAVHPAYFTADPFKFNPIGLNRVVRNGTKNGVIISWMEPVSNIEVFRWDQNPNFKNGAHYHVYGQGHYYGGDLVPEPLGAIYFHR